MCAKRHQKSSTIQQALNTINYYVENVLPKWESTLERDDNLDYFIDFIRFEYIRRNKDYQSEWDTLINSSHVVENEEGQAVYEDHHIEEGSKKIMQFIEKWGIKYAINPDEFLPSKVDPIFENIFVKSYLKVEIYNGNSLSSQYLWYNEIDVSTGQCIKSKGKSFYLEYESSEIGGCLLGEKPNDVKNTTKPVKYQLDSNSGVSVSLFKKRKKKTYLKIIFDDPNETDVNLIPFNSPPYDIKIRTNHKLIHTNMIKDYQSSIPKTRIIYPNFLKGVSARKELDYYKGIYDDITRHIVGLDKKFFKTNKDDDEKISLEWDDTNWHLIAINKNVKKKDLIADLEKKIKFVDMRGKGFNLKDHLRRLSIWELKRACDNAAQVAGKFSLFPLLHHQKTTKSDTTLDDATISRLNKEAQIYIDAKYEEIY